MAPLRLSQVEDPVFPTLTVSQQVKRMVDGVASKEEKPKKE